MCKNNDMKILGSAMLAIALVAGVFYGSTALQASSALQSEYSINVLAVPERINDDRQIRSDYKLAWDYFEFQKYQVSRVQVSGVGSIPIDAKAVEVNFEVYSTIPAARGWVVLFRCGAWEKNGELVTPDGTPMAGLDGDPFPPSVGGTIPNVSLGNFPGVFNSSIGGAAALGSAWVALSDQGAICLYKQASDSLVGAKYRVEDGMVPGTPKYLDVLKNPSLAILDVTAYTTEVLGAPD